MRYLPEEHTVAGPMVRANAVFYMKHKNLEFPVLLPEAIWNDSKL